MLGEAEADEHSVCVCVFVWDASGVQGFCLAKGPFFDRESCLEFAELCIITAILNLGSI